MIEIETDISVLERKLKIYTKFIKKTPAEALNKKIYDCSLQAVNTTKAADREKIRTDRMKPSLSNPSAPLQAILTNKRLGPGRGLNGAKLAAQVERDIRAAQRSANFIRAGWKKAGNDIRPYVTNLSGSPRSDSGVTVRNGSYSLGKGKPAIENDAYIVEAEIINRVEGKNKSEAVTRIKEVGKQAAIQRVIADMDVYIERKMSEGADQFNNS